MAFGVQWINNSGVVAISTERYGLVYIGNATATSTQKPDAYTQISGGGSGGYSTGGKDLFYIYTIVSPSPPTCFLELLPNFQAFAICSINNTGGNNWEIVVAGHDWSRAPNVKCFARLQGNGGSGFGLRCFDANGQRTWDSTEKMLVISQRLDWAASSDSSTVNLRQQQSFSATAPYMLGRAGAYISGTISSTTASAGFWTMTEYLPAVRWEQSTGTLYRDSTSIIADKYRDDFKVNSHFLFNDRTYIINGNNY